ncbi:unnamed protein product [Lymnaea stagnalis]|uniref:DUF7920 domain-containing protein n=1 Tax=Lymnaea stagnalis TaxID=6523 RepID=A0AAV2HMK7_LYMST
MENTENESGSKNLDKEDYVFLPIIESIDPSIKGDVEAYLKTVVSPFDEKSETVKTDSWIEWAKRLKYLKLVYTGVPDFILPKNYSGELIDVKVFCKRGPDDSIYDTYKLVRDRVSKISTSGSTTSGKYLFIYGVNVLFFMMKMDSLNQHTLVSYTISQPLEAVKKVVATRKANGEAAHLSCIRLDGQYLICAGSKNVHVLIRNRGDISFYRGDRYRIASEVCHSIMDLLEEMTPAQKDRLLSFLVVSRFTAVFEILSPAHQHVENLSYLTKPVVQFITWTSTELEPMPDKQLCTVPPHIGIQIARALGLKTIDYEVISNTEVDERMKQIRQGYQYEGEVLYFLDETDVVIGLLKKKTAWYILCRAIREKARASAASLLKNRSTFSLSKSIKQVEKRMDEIQKWLGLSDQVKDQWRDLGVSFISYCVKQLENGYYSMEDIAERFPIVWKDHLEASGFSDQILVECTEEEDPSPLVEGAAAY